MPQGGISVSSIEEKQQERIKVRNDLLTGKKPKRVFIEILFSSEAAFGLAGMDFRKAHFSTEMKEKAFDRLCETFPADAFPIYPSRDAFFNQYVGNKTWVMGSDGTFQHPDTPIMNPGEYDEFSDAPYKFIVEKLIPRAASRFNSDPVTNGIRLMSAYEIFQKNNNTLKSMLGKISAKYGYAPNFATAGNTNVPFDILSRYRSFTGIINDAYRIPGKVKAAVDALTPLMIARAAPLVRRPGLISFVPLHMGPFLNKKVFDGLYWPNMERLALELDKIGVACQFFVESDWTRYIPYLERLPKSSIMYMEQGDPEVFTGTIGREHVFGGFYDPTISLVRSKEECIDEAKRLLDIVMKTGKYYFQFDKSVIDIKSIDVSKIQAVLEWVAVNAQY